MRRGTGIDCFYVGAGNALLTVRISRHQGGRAQEDRLRLRARPAVHRQRHQAGLLRPERRQAAPQGLLQRHELGGLDQPGRRRRRHAVLHPDVADHEPGLRLLLDEPAASSSSSASGWAGRGRPSRTSAGAVQQQPTCLSRAAGRARTASPGARTTAWSRSRTTDDRCPRADFAPVRGAPLTSASTRPAVLLGTPPMYIYVMGRGHSGSTILDILIGGGAAVESVGELGASGLPGTRRRRSGQPVRLRGADRRLPVLDRGARDSRRVGPRPVARPWSRPRDVRNFWGTWLASPAPPATRRLARLAAHVPARGGDHGRRPASRTSSTPTRSRPGPCSCSSTTRAPGSSTSCATRAGSCRATTGASAAAAASDFLRRRLPARPGRGTPGPAARRRLVDGRQPAARSWRCARAPGRVAAAALRGSARRPGRAPSARSGPPFGLAVDDVGGPARARRAVPGRAQRRRQPHPPRARGAVRPGDRDDTARAAAVGGGGDADDLLAADALLRLPGHTRVSSCAERGRRGGAKRA